MKYFYSLLFFWLLALQVNAQEQPVSQDASVKPAKIDEVQFFINETPLEVDIGVNLRRIMANKFKEGYKFPAKFTITLEDGKVISEPVTLEVRGNYRKANCYMPPLKVNFKGESASYLSSLGSLKLVNVCEIDRKDNEEFLLKEYLIYKIYNQITEKSLRARLLKIRFIDSNSKKKPVTEYGFLLEDVKDMARRNGCVERKRDVPHTESTERQQMTRVALFEYMIGNSDWSVPVRHNIKLIVPKEDTNAVAYSVPYDFDHSGLVKTDYALPPEQLDIKDVTQRAYRGFPRSFEELQLVIGEFQSKKDTIYQIIKNFTLLSGFTRNEVISYLNGFYDTISKPKDVRIEFIQNARSNEP